MQADSIPAKNSVAAKDRMSEVVLAAVSEASMFKLF